MAMLVAERRTGERTPSQGPVEIFFDIPIPTTVSASLLDTSSTGFRAKHDCAALEPGLEISYHREGEMGHARVVWTMISGPQRVSGFMIL